MKYKSLRTLMKKKNLGRPYNYANKPLVIDGLCFKELYMRSGSLFILGGEYDRYASFLRNFFSNFIKCNIKCYIIFNGAMDADVERRLQIHQNIIDRVDAIKPNAENEYCEPIYVKDVYKDVLQELGIKYYVVMCDSRAALFSLAKKLKCPILTNNTEYALYGVTVILFKSVVINNEAKSIACSIYHENKCREWNSFSSDIMSLVLTMANENSKFYKELLKIFQCREAIFITKLLYWIRRQSKDGVIKFIKSNFQEENQKVFLNTFAELRGLLSVLPNTPITNAIVNGSHTRPRNDDEWFEHAVGIGRIAIQFINLYNSNLLSGSWVVFDKNREDSMLAALDIAFYVQGLLKKSQEIEISFLGRKHSLSNVSLFKKTVNLPPNRRGSKPAKLGADFDDFKFFLKEQLLGFSLAKLGSIPEDCWILLISLLYYSKKAEHHFMLEAYCIILSYILLGPVSEKVGIIKRSNFSITHGIVNKDNNKEEVKGVNEMLDNNLTHEQCMQTASAVVDFFYPLEVGIKDFDRHALHTFAEFQYCLQFMNYLNKICGEPIKCTAYHKTINCTFIYNLFITLPKEDIAPEIYIEKLLNCPQAFKFFEKILNCYLTCLSLITENKKKVDLSQSEINENFSKFCTVK